MGTTEGSTVQSTVPEKASQPKRLKEHKHSLESLADLENSKRQKVEVRVPGHAFNECVAMYKPHFAVHSAPVTNFSDGLFDHHGHPFRFQKSDLRSSDALDQLESKDQRCRNQLLPGYQLREFEITTRKGEAVEPFLFQTYPKGMKFSGVLYGHAKAAFVTEGLFSGARILRPDSSQFAIQVFIHSSTHPQIYFLLRKPSNAYRTLFQMFLWNAILIRNVVDWAVEVGDISLPMLRTQFGTWLESRFSNDPQYHAWKCEISTGGDYRHYVANVRFLLAQHLEEKGIHATLLRDSYLQRFEEPVSSCGLEKTLVTPTVYHWFRSSFGKQMYTLDPDAMTQPPNDLIPKTTQDLWSTDDAHVIETENGCTTKIQVSSGILAVGDCVEVYRDDSGPEDTPEDAWIARIISFDVGKEIQFRLVWMYSINQTFLFDAGSSTLSPLERFYSHHCECSQPFSLSVIKRKVELEMLPQTPKDCKTYFCRYFYNQDSLSFIDLGQAPISHIKSGKLLCQCTLSGSRQAAKRALLLDRHQIGQTFTIDLSGQDGTSWIAPEPRLLTVGQLQAYHPQTKSFSFRIFPRIREVSAYMEVLKKPLPSMSFELNELLYSPHIVQCTPASIIAPCHIEFIPQSARCDPVPINLKHRGSGNQFFFTYTTDDGFTTIQPPLVHQMPFLQASFPARSGLIQDLKPLRALDLFSGSGSLGLGIGDAGFARSRWAVDFEPNATEAYRMNQPPTHPLTLYTESVNRSLHNIINRDANYPAKGDVDLILAGTPCQGYSLLNRNRESDAALSKSSMITSLASFVDHLRPTHVLMEQISNFTQFRLNIKGLGGHPPQHPFRQLMQLFLFLDYQIRILTLSATNHGSCQMRNRVFIWCTTRTHPLPIHPAPAHLSQVTPYTTIAGPGNQRISIHQSPEKAALPPITVRDMIGDLPPLGLSARPHSSPDISFHAASPSSAANFERLERVPLGFGIANAHGLQLRASLPNSTLELPSCISTMLCPRERALSFARVDPDGQMPTIATTVVYKSTFPTVHFAEPRFLSVREVARMQGFLDSDQFAGKQANQFKLIGNAVARCVAFSLGLGLAARVNQNQIKDMLHPPNPAYYASSHLTIHGDNPFQIPKQDLKENFNEFTAAVSKHLSPTETTPPYRLVFTCGTEGARWLIEDDASLKLAIETCLAYTKGDESTTPEIWHVPITLSPDLTEHMS
ncbi:hypothetical protein DSO57_1016267 [Entomophthora muscae]|uniref:Uncharacterized protein n=1 Tax=Entomophthora muscae TaxID=34485 RepID=A0ACC2TSL9_9FUNG|nr:hypothetical protein DSO57_1016267 [Entomophthora muscae]